MILGIGTDICEIARFEAKLAHHGQKFIDRIFTVNEQALCENLKDKTGFYAKRYAGKEAILKALGTGLAQGIHWQDVEILRLPSGAPHVQLLNKASAIATARAPASQWHISLSDEKAYAIAFVVWSKA